MTEAEEPYMVSEFGEIIHFRPGGCPNPECDATEITETARSCPRCNAQFEPWNELSRDDAATD